MTKASERLQKGNSVEKDDNWSISSLPTLELLPWTQESWSSFLSSAHYEAYKLNTLCTQSLLSRPNWNISQCLGRRSKMAHQFQQCPHLRLDWYAECIDLRQQIISLLEQGQNQQEIIRQLEDEMERVWWQMIDLQTQRDNKDNTSIANNTPRNMDKMSINPIVRNVIPFKCNLLID